MKTDYPELVTSLEKIGLKATIQEDTNQIATSFKQNDFEYPVFVRQLSGGHLLQMITFIPCSVHPEALPELGRLLHMVNKELDMPGFCCDEESKTVFYRLVIPCINGEVDQQLFQSYADTSQQVCKMFGVVVHAIAIKAMSLDKMLEQAKAAQAEKAEKK